MEYDNRAIHPGTHLYDVFDIEDTFQRGLHDTASSLYPLPRIGSRIGTSYVYRSTPDRLVVHPDQTEISHVHLPWPNIGNQVSDLPEPVTLTHMELQFTITRYDPANPDTIWPNLYTDDDVYREQDIRYNLHLVNTAYRLNWAIQPQHHPWTYITYDIPQDGSPIATEFVKPAYGFVNFKTGTVHTLYDRTIHLEPMPHFFQWGELDPVPPEFDLWATANRLNADRSKTVRILVELGPNGIELADRNDTAERIYNEQQLKLSFAQATPVDNDNPDKKTPLYISLIHYRFRYVNRTKHNKKRKQ